MRLTLTEAHSEDVSVPHLLTATGSTQMRLLSSSARDHAHGGGALGAVPRAMHNTCCIEAAPRMLDITHYHTTQSHLGRLPITPIESGQTSGAELLGPCCVIRLPSGGGRRQFHRGPEPLGRSRRDCVGHHRGRRRRTERFQQLVSHVDYRGDKGRKSKRQPRRRPLLLVRALRGAPRALIRNARALLCPRPEARAPPGPPVVVLQRHTSERSARPRLTRHLA